MNASRRREFLADVGRGMLIASVGPALALDLGLSPALADETPQPLSFGTDPETGRVDLGGRPPRPPTDPGVRVRRTRLFIS